MMIRNIFFVFFFSVIAPMAAMAQEAPFGLQWGATIEEVRATGVDLKEDNGKQFGLSFYATKIPKVLSDQEASYLSFGFNNKLWRVVAIGKIVDNEPFGHAVKQRYDELVEALAPKYGSPLRVHRLGESIYREPRYFVSGLRGGDSVWYSDFTNTSVFVQASIVGTSSSAARWRIIFEDTKLQKQFEIDKKAQERGAL
ncbi:MAG: hypothetical protein K2Y29_11400 [Beijerinckiaceae bacterium]|nr:hypothetical protein [Beijerinckiaceae bacterium]